MLVIYILAQIEIVDTFLDCCLPFVLQSGIGRSFDLLAGEVFDRQKCLDRIRISIIVSLDFFLFPSLAQKGNFLTFY